VWRPKDGYFACVISDPRGIEKRKWYTVTVAEEPQSTFLAAPALAKHSSTEHIRFS
jgi:hypothetical protein